MKKIIGFFLTLMFIVPVMGAAAQGIDGTTRTLCDIEGHEYTVAAEAWCTRSDCAVCNETKLVYGVVDVNQDGSMNILDLVRLKKYAADSGITVGEAADVNVDGTAGDALDIVDLRKLLLGAY